MELPRCLGGMWCPQKLIGEGSYGAVYLANHLILPTRKAVKRIELYDGNMDDIAKEVGALQRLKGKPNIVQLWQWVEYEGALYIIMEFCQGGDLHEYLQLKGSLNEDCCRDIMLQLAEGLKAMRACNVVHRDLKPSNILLCDKGNQPRIKIADFGLARMLDGRACSAFSYVPSPYGYLLQGQASSQCGTMPYAAPEMESGPHGLDVDLWSVGVIMYEMLVGRHPFNADNYYDLMQSFRNDEIELPDDVAKKLSPACRDMLTRLLQRNPADRMSFAEFVIHPFFRGPSAVAATVEDEHGQCDGQREEEHDHDDPEADLEDQELLDSSSLERLWMKRPDTLHTIEEEEAISLSGALHRARECTPSLRQSVLELDCDARESDSGAAAINAEIDVTDDADDSDAERVATSEIDSDDADATEAGSVATVATSDVDSDDADATEAESDATVATSEVDSDDADATEAESDADGATSDFQGDAEANYFEGSFSIASAVIHSAVAAERAYKLCSSGSSDHVPSRVAHQLQMRRMAALLLTYACRVHLGLLHLEVLASQCSDGERHRAGDLVKATVVAVSCCRWAYRLVVLASRSGDTEGGGGPEDDHKELSASLEFHARSMLVMVEKHLSYHHDVLPKMPSRGCRVTPPGTASDLISCQAVVAVAAPHPASAQDTLLEVALSHVRAAEDEEMLGNTATAAAEYGKATDVLLFLLSAAALQQLPPQPRPTICDQQTPLEAVRPPMAQNVNPRLAVLYARTRMRQSGIHAAMRTTAAAAAATTSEVTVQAMSEEAVFGLPTSLNANRRSWWQWMFG